MLNIPANFWIGILGSIIFGIVAASLLLGSYKIFDYMLPKVDFQEKLNENNTAVAIVICGFFLSISWVVAACVQ